MDEEKSATNEIIGTFSYRTYENEDRSFCVYKYIERESGKVFTAVGPMLPNRKELAVKLIGTWEVNKKAQSQKQFKVLYFEDAVPSQKSEVIAYFCALKCGIGKVKAKAIYECFGDQTFSILEQEPEKFYNANLISRKNYEDLLAVMKSNDAYRDVLKLFASAGISVGGDVLRKLTDKLGPEPQSAIKENPFCLLRTVRGFSFEKCDAIAGLQNIPKDSLFRLKAAIIKLLDDAALRGHVCLPRQELLQNLIAFTGCSQERCVEAIREAFKERQLFCANDYLYTKERYLQEESIANNLNRLIRARTFPITEVDAFISEYEENNFPFADSQREAIRNVYRNNVSIITGGPGVGKTTVTKGILAVHQGIYGLSSVPLLLAPTGKASRRLSEATGYPAQTIHSAVGWKGEEYDYDSASAPMLEENLIIVDESSMMDQQIASVLLDKVKSGCRLVLVGDTDQLPSVGCGNVLGDMIRSGVIPTTRLNVIYRQAGENPIISNAHAINRGEVSHFFLQDMQGNLTANPEGHAFGKTFQFITAKDEEEVFEAACAMYRRCVKAFGYENVILLNPQKNKTNIGVERFNAELQARLNPSRAKKYEITIGKTTFREGDKVMEQKNTDIGPKNGDVGYIREITRRPDPDDPNSYNYYANIEFNNDGNLIEYSSDDMRHVSLAYCMTVHKSQGSEYETVIMVVSKAHPSMLKRNLVYTGITRAKKNVAIIGEFDAFARAISNNSAEVRYTLLANRLSSALKT